MALRPDGLPFSPFTAMLRDLIREIGPDEVAALLPGGGRATRELARLLPELAELPAVPAAAVAGGIADSGSAAAAGVSEARARLFEEFLTLLEHLAERSELIVVMEDAHWADQSSRDLLAFLIRYQPTLRNTLIVVTFRTDELHRTHPLRSLLAELGRMDWVERVDLPRLTREQAAELTAAIRDAEDDPDLAERLYQRAEGNPLFTEELLACPGGDAGEIPGSLADLLLQAVRRLPEETQEVLRVASAGIGVSGHALLARVSGHDDASLSRAIRPAVTANVLVTTDDGYTFRHALIREAVHKDLLPGEHSQVHARFAEAIDADPGLVPGGRAAIEKAHHWHAAHNTTWALVSAWQAASQARDAVALAERLMLLVRVLELWNRVPDAARRIGADHVRVLEDAADSARDAGEDQRGLGFASSAIGELDEDSDPARFAVLLSRRFRFRDNLGLPGAIDDLDRALRLVPAKVSRPARLQVLLDYAHCRDVVRDSRFRAMTEEALLLARETADAEAESQALTSLAMGEAGRGEQAMPGSEPLALTEQARVAALRSRTLEPRLKAAITESHLLCGAGQYERAAAVARQGITDAEGHALARTSGAVLAINVAEPLLPLGRWDEARDIVERALVLAPPPLIRAQLWTMAGLIALARGDVRQASRHAAAADTVLADARYEDQHQLPQATLELAARQVEDGPVATAALAIQLLDRYDLARSSPRYAWPLAFTALSVAVAAGDALAGVPHASSAELFDRARSVAEKLEAFGPVQEAWQLMFRAANPLAEPADGRLAAWDIVTAAWEQLRQPWASSAPSAAPRPPPRPTPCGFLRIHCYPTLGPGRQRAPMPVSKERNLMPPAPAGLRFRAPCPDDAHAIAALHADSWRRHYRGAYSDAFLDGDVLGYLRALWTGRLAPPAPRARTILAERDGAVVGLAHTFLDADPAWGALLDNLHVASRLKRHGVGTRLLALTGQAVLDGSPSSGLHLWVLERNADAQAFYTARGGACVERKEVPPPGGDPARLHGKPMCLRYAWPNPSKLLAGHP